MTQIPKIHLPKPISEEMRKAKARRWKWRRRMELAARKLREIKQQIDLMQFQEDLEAIRPHEPLPSRMIAQSGFEWGIFWKDALITTLPLHQVKGLGKSRCHQIVKSFRTVGDLEVWRISHGFSSIPGVTKTTAKNLEEMLIRWLQTYAPDYSLRASSDSLPIPKKQTKTQGGVLCLYPVEE